MGFRHQLRRLLHQRVSKSRRTERSQRRKYRPMLENLEQRMLLAGFWTQIQPTNPSAGPVDGTQALMLLSNGFVIAAPEIYNPLTNTWTSVAPMPSPATQVANSPSVPPLTPQSQFGDDPIQVLPNGDILAGWFNDGNTFVYNVASNTWRQTTGAKI